MLAELTSMTALVATVNVVALLPAGMVTLAGTRAFGLLLDRKTVAPPAGAGVASPTVPRTEPPPIVDTGSIVSARMPGVAGRPGSTRSTAPCMPAPFPYDAWISTHRLKLTAGATIGNVALLLPAGIVTLPPGVTTSPSMLPFTHTLAPPLGAGPVSVTVPVVEPPPRMLEEASVTDDRAGTAAGDPAGRRISHVSGAR